MRSLPLVLAALGLAACASAPVDTAPVEAAAPVAEGYGRLIEDAANALIAAEPEGAVPAGLEIDVLSVEEMQSGLFYSAELRTPGRRRRAEDYVIYGQCPASDIPACASQILAGARMLAKSR